MLNIVDNAEYIDVEEDAVEIWKLNGSKPSHEFPTVSVYHTKSNNLGTLYFNVPARRLLKQQKYIKYLLSTNYVVLKFVESKDPQSFGLYGNHYATYLAFPSMLENRGIKDGTYKLYKCQDGLCFKRYEPLTED